MVLSSLSISQFLETIMQQFYFLVEFSTIIDLSYDPSTIMVCPATQSGSIPVEIELGKTLNINSQLCAEQKEQLLILLREDKDSFS